MPHVQNIASHKLAQPALILAVAFFAGRKRILERCFPGASQGGLLVSAAIVATIDRIAIFSIDKSFEKDILKKVSKFMSGIIVITIGNHIGHLIAKRFNNHISMPLSAAKCINKVQILGIWTLNTIAYFFPPIPAPSFSEKEP